MSAAPPSGPLRRCDKMREQRRNWGPGSSTDHPPEHKPVSLGLTGRRVPTDPPGERLFRSILTDMTSGLVSFEFFNES